MEWQQLELRKASNLKREVDLVIGELNELAKKGNARRLEALKRAVGDRIDELEEFYLENDDDERSILFEKQRLRLRRALQQASLNTSAAQTARNAMRPKKGGKVGGHDAHKAQELSGKSRAQSSQDQLHGADPHTPMKVQDLMSQQTQYLSTPQHRQGASDEAWEQKANVEPRSATMQPRGRKKDPIGETAEAPAPLLTRYGMFDPSGQAPGIYIKQGEGTISQTRVDFIVALSAADEQRLSSMRRARAARKRRTEIDVESVPYLFSSLPYIERDRAMNLLGRD